MKLQELFHDWEDIEKYRANTVIFAELDPADLMYIVLSGEAPVSESVGRVLSCLGLDGAPD